MGLWEREGYRCPTVLRHRDKVERLFAGGGAESRLVDGIARYRWTLWSWTRGVTMRKRRQYQTRDSNASAGSGSNGNVGGESSSSGGSLEKASQQPQH